MKPLTYREQRQLENEVESLQREVSELRWRLSDRLVYGEEIARLADRKAELEAKCLAEDDEVTA